MSSLVPEHILDPLEVSPDQFLDCATAVVHTILFHRSIDTQVTPRAVVLPGVDIAYASAETEQTSEGIRARLAPMQDEVLAGRYAQDGSAWLILSLSHAVPRRGWFRATTVSEVWERWCITFSFSPMTASEIREQMLHTILQIKDKAGESSVPRSESGGAAFRFALSLPTDKDWETSKEFVNLVKKLCNTPSAMFT